MKHLIHKCPDCGNDLTRVKRTGTDRLLNVVSFNKLYNKRYYCYSCLKPVIFNSYQLHDVVAPSDKSPKTGLVLPKVYLSALLLTMVVLLAIAGNYFLSKTDINDNLSSNKSEEIFIK